MTIPCFSIYGIVTNTNIQLFRGKVLTFDIGGTFTMVSVGFPVHRRYTCVSKEGRCKTKESFTITHKDVWVNKMNLLVNGGHVQCLTTLISAMEKSPS